MHFEWVSQQSNNFHTKYRNVNYQDPNYNVQLPVFSIHGNHDDPAGDGGLAALDLLATANLVNYFGKVRVRPITLASPSAVLGGSSVKDGRGGSTLDAGR